MKKFWRRCVPQIEPIHGLLEELPSHDFANFSYNNIGEMFWSEPSISHYAWMWHCWVVPLVTQFNQRKRGKQMAYSKDGKVIAWWSAGVTSAVATKLALDAYGKDNVRIIYFRIDSAHPDNDRFIRECEEWYGKPIEVWRSDKYTDQFDVIEKTRYINGPAGARCTLELKKSVRFRVEKEVDYSHQVFGFEYNKKEINRAIRFLEQYPDAGGIFPLIEHKMTKPECLHFLEKADIKRPRMYELGFPNNNCIGCVKGGAGYWNLVRREFPEYFDKMAELEEKVGATCLKDKNGRIPRKNLDPERGHKQKIIMPDCGNFCDLEFTEIEHKKLDEVYENPSEIKEFYSADNLK